MTETTSTSALAPTSATESVEEFAARNLESVWRVGEDGFRSRSANSWLLGETLRGKVRLTVADGRVAYAA